MNNKIFITVIVIAIIVLGGYILLRKPQSPAPSPDTQTGPSEETPPTQPATTQEEEAPSMNENVVIYTDSGFSPSTIRVKIGATVTFKNESSKAMWPASAIHPSHKVYSGTSLQEHCPDINRTAFDACTGIQPGNSWSFTFQKKGNWKYHDHLNPGNTGTILVE